ncbi:hypothetical protein GQ43DRAFT_192728 [Delitschia confertaspora ATCC 74209]|uniref:Uncharacterized protein n=1 Tax=Delitschia confertaspora ATCC 74209 TaxID=1513339 RepID=A0A9P4MSK1_9PLEO|nr:hypothetical protein GQ43DRAFT_192728 [Delitschia confertaspora ATCC 74209]
MAARNYQSNTYIQSGLLWRELLPDDKTSITIDVHVIPHGTWVGIHVYSLYNNEKYFPDLFVFKPERWLLHNLCSGSNFFFTVFPLVILYMEMDSFCAFGI